MDVAEVIDQLITSYNIKQILDDFIYAQVSKLIVNLSSQDLRHKLNTIRYKPKDKRSDFTSIPANTISG